MRTLIGAVALAAVIVSPALAQTNVRRALVPHPSQSDPSIRRSEIQRPAINSGNSGNAVYSGKEYVGADPDPNVRMNLRIDYEMRM